MTTVCACAGFAVFQLNGLPGDGTYDYSFSKSSFTDNGDDGLEIGGNTRGGFTKIQAHPLSPSWPDKLER